MTDLAKPKFNPFRPGSIVTPGMFAGRGVELIAIEQCFFQTKNGNPSHFLIHGERGIGKSSLLYFEEKIAKGEIESLRSGTFSYLTLSVELDGSTTLRDLIHKIACELKGELAKRQPATELGKGIWDFLKRWEVMGVRYDDKKAEH